MGLEAATIAAIAAATSAAAGVGSMAYTMSQGKPDMPNIDLPQAPDQGPKPEAALQQRRRFQTVLSQPGQGMGDAPAPSAPGLLGNTTKLGG